MFTEILALAPVVCIVLALGALFYFNWVCTLLP
ncbi:MAG: hypothetical protein USCGTAYLOR_02837 [Chromatiales bacterium USCg_Taylor]|nr:MAG: hypothetical protein USCGTAYLOR_02837 [Chromatiales bacterium USCg_Taylor]